MYRVCRKDEYKCIVIVDVGISLKVDVLVQVWLDCVNEQWLKADVNKQCGVIMMSGVWDKRHTTILYIIMYGGKSNGKTKENHGR